MTTKSFRTLLRVLFVSFVGFTVSSSMAITFDNGSISGNFDSTVSVGLAARTQAPSCSLVIQGATGSGAPVGCVSLYSGLGDQGTLNYAKGDRFMEQIKGSHELLLKLPNEWTFMGRVNWVRDFAATNTTGIASAATPPGLDDNLAADARRDLRFKGRLLDFWVSKQFEIGDQRGRVRVGNQVISWGESLFLPGGINSTNALDFMRLSQPGTQLKEAVLPAPAISIASGLGAGVNIEAYVQTGWNSTYYAPTGSFWSVGNGLGKGAKTYGYVDGDARDSGQWGVALSYQPASTQINLGIYAMNYHDKTPNFTYNFRGTGAMGWDYIEDRKMIGVSANVPAGDWAIGAELAYRPRDAVSLNSNSGCAAQRGNCWVDEKQYRFATTALLSMTPGATGGDLLRFVGADTGYVSAEAVVVRYPNLKKSYSGSPIAAGLWGWGFETDVNGTPVPTGTKTSAGFNFDFGFVYDGTLIPGWQVIPGVYYFQAVSGRTPNFSALFMKGAKSANFYLSFIQNPANWQATLNFARFAGGDSVFDQPYRDRSFVGAVLSRNF